MIFSADDFQRVDHRNRWKESLDETRHMFAAQSRKVIPLPVQWRFRTDPKDQGVKDKWFDAATDAQWKEIRIDDVWENQGYGREQYKHPDGYNGIAWYRLDEVKIPALSDGQRCLLRFGAVDESCWVYVNGRPVGQYIYDAAVDPLGWKKPHQFDITDALKPDAANTITMRVQDLSGNGGIWKGAWLLIENAAATTPATQSAGQALFNEDFTSNDWHDKTTNIHKGDEDQLSLKNGALDITVAHGLPDHNVSLSWLVPQVPPGTLISFQMRIRTEDVKPNEGQIKSWLLHPKTPVARIIPLDAKHKAVAKPKDYIWAGFPFATSSDGWQIVKRMFRTPAGTSAASLTIFLNAAGHYSIDDIAIQVMK